MSKPQHRFDLSIANEVHKTWFHPCAIKGCSLSVEFLVEFVAQGDPRQLMSSMWWMYTCQAHYHLLFKSLRVEAVRDIRKDSVGLFNTNETPILLPTQTAYGVQKVVMIGSNWRFEHIQKE